MMNHLISGMHTSLNSHICENFVDIKTNIRYPNLKFYFERVAIFPDRIKNLFYSYSFVLRAFEKII
jgi:ERO1-like protein beta